MTDSVYDALVYEHMLMTRLALHDVPVFERDAHLDRSATVLLARLSASGPLTIAELADAFGLDVSTVHRQVAAAMRAGLIEKIRDPDGGVARKHRPTSEGLRRVRAELDARAAAVSRATEGWPEDDVRTLVSLMRQLNEGSERLRQRPWPRPDNASADQIREP